MTTITIAVEDSGPTTMSDSDLSEQSISINMENSDPDSISETCKRNPDCCDKTKTTSDYGVTNLGFVKDGDESKDNKERKQKCSSSSFEDIPMVIRFVPGNLVFLHLHITCRALAQIARQFLKWSLQI